MDFETIRFISVLNQLAEKTKNGYIPFSQATAEDTNCIMYDDTTKYSNGYPIILDAFIDENHHDIIDTYNNIYAQKGIIIRLVIVDEEPFVNITSEYNQNIDIVIEGGKWYNTIIC